jgi:mobilization protein NikA
VQTERLCIRLTTEELEELRGLAARARLSVSELIRQWIRLGELPVRVPGEPERGR